MPRKRRDPKQTTLAFRPAGRGGARPGAGRKRVRRSRVPHRTREGIPARCPVHVTLRVLDADRDCEVAAPHTWLLTKGWRRIGLIDPAEVPGGNP